MNYANPNCERAFTSENYIEVLIQILNEQTAIAEKSIVKSSWIMYPMQPVTYFCLENDVEPQQPGGSISRPSATFRHF